MKLTIAELSATTDVPAYKIVGAMVAAGKQQEFDIERRKHPSRQKAFMTESEFKKIIKEY